VCGKSLPPSPRGSIRVLFGGGFGSLRPAGNPNLSAALVGGGDVRDPFRVCVFWQLGPYGRRRRVTGLIDQQGGVGFYLLGDNHSVL
jgi:hypothetical protein